MWKVPGIPFCKRWGWWRMHTRKEQLPVETRPLVFSHSLLGSWQSQIGLLLTDSQMSSSILIQKAHRRHQLRLNFPMPNPRAEMSQVSKKWWSWDNPPRKLCQYVIIIIAAIFQHSNPVQMCQQNSPTLLLFPFTYYLLLDIWNDVFSAFTEEAVKLNYLGPAPLSCFDEEFVKMNRHMRKYIKTFF